MPILNNSMELVPLDVNSKEEALKLYSDNKKFYVEDNNAAYRVEKHNLNPLLQEVIKRGAMGKFKDAGYIRVNKLEEGRYELLAKVRGDGGGPWGAWVMYNLTKTTIYSAAGIAAGATIGGIVAASGGTAAAPLVAGAGAATGKAIGTGLGMAAASSTSVGIAGAGVAGGIVNAAGAQTVGTVAGGLLASTGSAAGVIAAVEGASLFVGAIFAGPWCP